jgi:hypothetical protein
MTQNLAVAQRTLQPFQSSYTVVSGDAAYNTSAEVAALVQANTTSGVYALIWQRTIPAQQVVRWGFGDPAFQLLVSYNWFAALDEGTGFEDGSLRLVISNATGTKTTTVKEFNTTLMHTTTNTNLGTAVPSGTDQLTPLPEQTIVAAGEDSLLQLHFRTETATTTVDACNFSLGVTIYQ